ncbi:sensor histidine kinase [Actinoplanes sp. CA-142083]|uniref:sensor histidine kinase n=1 Tax=Actinoplanes sp. CA-142083 TaxID=3239903 RepID=UPI003D903EE2
MRTRNWSIRSKIITMVTVPLAALLAVWLFATALTAGPALSLLSARTLADNVGNPGEVVVGELQRERRLSVQYLSDTSATLGLLTEQRAATDRAIDDFRKAAQGGDAWRSASDNLRGRIGQFFTELNVLPSQRAHIDRRELDAIGAQNIYNGMVTAGFDMFAATATFPDDEIDRQVRALATLGRGQEYLSRVDSLLAGATVAGKFTDDLRSALVQDVGTARFLLATGVDEMPAGSRAAYQQLSRTPPFVQINSMMDRLIAQSRSGQISPVGADSWHGPYTQSAQQLRDFENVAIDGLADRGQSLAVTILLRLALAAILGLIAFGVSVAISVKVGRSMVGRLRRLRAEALEMATERLPNVVRRLQRGETVDVEVETPPLRYGKDEIGQLGHAFNDVQRTAVQSAVEEANVRRGLNEVFLNIARRSQTLLHRQLALLDRMERRETEPQELEDLYRVDHLATRMRRHAEDLVILAGAAPGRGWRNPVPVVDVIRGAISEVEDYKRIDIRGIESSAILGRAVGDVIHLLAELLENATSFSPPHTRVQVSGQVLPNGYAIEIEDRGLGMTHEAIDVANRRLVEPPDFDPADSARLGLFVVAQLANRHGIRVSLRQSAYAGITAIVLVPGELVVAGPDQAALPGGSAPDKSWERPLVGSGTEDRRSLASLQWQGAEKLREITVTGRPVILTHPEIEITTSAEEEAEAGKEAAVQEAGAGQIEPAFGGPVPSSIADGLTEDGLVQRRRKRRPIDLATADPIPLPTAEITQALTVAPQQVTPEKAAPEKATPEKPALPTRARSRKSRSWAGDVTPGNAPTSAAPMFASPTSAPPAAGAAAHLAEDVTAKAVNAEAVTAEAVTVEVVTAEVVEGVIAQTTEDGLPKRVRQANLAPQLRRPAGALPDEPTVPLRSPEQVRSIMSALQSGTTRGRIDAARLGIPKQRNGSPSEDRPKPEKNGNGGSPGGASFADAATVSFPAIVAVADNTTGDDTVAGNGNGTEPTGKKNTRPEKDA